MLLLQKMGAPHTTSAKVADCYNCLEERGLFYEIVGDIVGERDPTAAPVRTKPFSADFFSSQRHRTQFQNEWYLDIIGCFCGLLSVFNLRVFVFILPLHTPK
jgi:hypothetical protein